MCVMSAFDRSALFRLNDAMTIVPLVTDNYGKKTYSSDA